MANVTMVDEPKGIGRLAFGYSRRKFDAVVDPVRACANHNGVLVAMGALETCVEKCWKKLDPHLRWLATESVAGSIGCSWCTDYGYFEGMQEGVDHRKVRDVFSWRDSDAYDERERVVLEYAECATSTPALVSDDLVARLHSHFSDEEIVELIAWIALENFRSRINAGLGLTSEGFSEKCQVV